MGLQRLCSVAFVSLLSIGQLSIGQLQAADWTASVSKVTNEVIRPGYQALEDSFGHLESSVSTFCAQPPGKMSEVDYLAVREAWKEAMFAWMQVSWIQFGPVSSGTPRFDIQIWPIRKGITHKTVQRLLKDPELSDTKIYQAGVSIRGLTGSEYLLFSGSGGKLSQYKEDTIFPGASSSNRCQILKGAVSNAHQTVAQLNKDWQTGGVISPYTQGVDMLDSDPKDPAKIYNSAASILWNALLAEIEFIQLRKLEGPLNIHGKKAKPTLAEAWRSLHSFENIQSQLVLLKGIYQTGFEALVNSKDSKLNERVLKSFDQLSKQLESFDQPMKEMLKDQEGREKIAGFRDQIQTHYTLLRSDVTPITGFILGFNANDGD